MATAPKYHYGRSIRKTTIQLLDLFNQFVIKRYELSAGSYQVSATDTLMVPIRFGPKEKLHEDLLAGEVTGNVTQNYYHPLLQLPMMILSFHGVQYDPTRWRAPFQSVYWQIEGPSGATWTKAGMPIPVIFQYTLSLATKYYDEQLQLYEQIYEKFFPNLYIYGTLNELGIAGSAGEQAKLPVQMNEFRGPDLQEKSLKEGMAAWFNTDIYMSVYGYIFKFQDPSGTQEPIYHVDTDVHATSYDDKDTMHEKMKLTVSAVPSAINAVELSGYEATGDSDGSYYEALQYYVMSGI